MALDDGRWLAVKAEREWERNARPDCMTRSPKCFTRSLIAACGHCENKIGSAQNIDPGLRPFCLPNRLYFLPSQLGGATVTASFPFSTLNAHSTLGKARLAIARRNVF